MSTRRRERVGARVNLIYPCGKSLRRAPRHVGTGTPRPGLRQPPASSPLSRARTPGRIGSRIARRTACSRRQPLCIFLADASSTNTPNPQPAPRLWDACSQKMPPRCPRRAPRSRLARRSTLRPLAPPADAQVAFSGWPPPQQPPRCTASTGAVQRAPPKGRRRAAVRVLCARRRNTQVEMKNMMMQKRETASRPSASMIYGRNTNASVLGAHLHRCTRRTSERCSARRSVLA